jgi:ribosomal protein L25 (general stress protein Ctc)
MLTLNATTRTVTGKNAHKTLSADGFIPAVVYGPKQETLTISLPLAEFKRVLRSARLGNFYYYFSSVYFHLLFFWRKLDAAFSI